MALPVLLVRLSSRMVAALPLGSLPRARSPVAPVTAVALKLYPSAPLVVEVLGVAAMSVGSAVSARAVKFGATPTVEVPAGAKVLWLPASLTTDQPVGAVVPVPSSSKFSVYVPVSDAWPKAAGLVRRAAAAQRPRTTLLEAFFHGVEEG